MQSLIEQLFESVYQDKFDETKMLIQTTPALVNASEPRIKDHLIITVLMKGNLDLIKFVLSHPQFDHGYRNAKNNKTVMDAILSESNMDIVNIVINDPRYLLNGNKLSYQCALDCLEDAKASLHRLQQTKPNSKATARAEKIIESLEQISIQLLDSTIIQAKNSPDLRDAIILFAIATDDAVLFERLDKAGAKPSSMLGEFGKNAIPRHLLLRLNNPKLNAWFNAKLEQDAARIENNPHSFYNRAKEVERLETQLAELERQRLAAETEANLKVVESGQRLIGKVSASLKKEEPEKKENEPSSCCLQ